MGKKKAKNGSTKFLLRKIRTLSRERYLAKLSLGGLSRSKPITKRTINFKEQKMRNLEETIRIYSRVFDATYDELLRRGVSPAIIDDHLFYNWECRP